MSVVGVTAPPQVSRLAAGSGTAQRHGSRTLPVYGLCVHTTGGGPARSARTTGRQAIDVAIAIYTNGPEGPHYVIGYDGAIHAICDEAHVAWHAGWLGQGRARWRTWTAPAWWSSIWSRFNARTPADLLPPQANDPNSVYIGVELLGNENASGFTGAQYDALARLVVDVFGRQGIPLAQPPNTRLLGHEDLEPISRSNRDGGWDPGAHRRTPVFSWSTLWARIQALGAGSGGLVPTPSAPPSRPSTWTSIVAAPWAMFTSIAGVAEAAAAFAGGQRDPNRLTDIIFNARHRERGGRPIAAGETALAQEWRWIRDNVVSTVLRTASAVSGPPVVPAQAATSGFGRATPAARRWAGLVQLLDRDRGDIPLDFLLGWIAVESDGRIDVVTSLDERGFFQIHPDESKDARPPIDHRRLTTDADYSVRAGLQLVRYYADLARRRFPWIPYGSELFWRVVKLQHAMGSGLANRLLTEMHNRGIPITWDAIKRFEISDGPRFHALLRVEPGRFGRNVDQVFVRGRAIARSLGR